MAGEHRLAQSLLSILEQGNENGGEEKDRVCLFERNQTMGIWFEDWDNRKVTLDLFLLLTSCLASLIRS